MNTMNSDELMQNDVVNKLKELKPIYQQEGIEIVALFGSYARGTQKKYSDIDIAYRINHEECSKKYPDAFSKLIRFEEIQKELKAIFKKDIDFVPDANKKILEDMITI